MAKIELKITNNSGYSAIVDVLEDPFRLNRTVFTPSEDRLKTLGGVTSTNIRLAKSKRNNILFTGKSEFDDYSKFNNGEVYKAVLVENGAELARGTFSFNEGSISWEAYEGTFYDENIDWVSELANRKLNEVGYVDGKPTWLVPFDGAITFNQVNDLTNKDTDFVCPTIVYNNTPLADYLDLTDEEVWGTFDLSDPANPKRLTPAFDINDFVCETGTFGTRLGSTFDGFPPAVNYKNLIERVFNDVGVEIDCPLFNEAWFNAIYLPYVGDEYKYNWKNLATVSADLDEQLDTFDRDIDPIDVRKTLTFLEPLDLQNTFDLNNQAGGTSGITLPYPQYANMKAKFQLSSCIEHDLTNTLVDKITAVNKFNIEGQYIAPQDGNYTINVKNGFIANNEKFTIGEDNPPANYTIFDGSDVWKSYATQDVNSSKALGQNDRHYGWSDQVLVVLRLNESGELIYKETLNDLFKWMSGENKDFINNPNDAIAYISPKRWEFFNSGAILDYKEAFGSPLTNNESEVEITGTPEHNVVFASELRKSAQSEAEITVSLDLKKNERVEIFWVSLADVEGDSTAWSGNPPGFNLKFYYSSDYQQVQYNRIFDNSRYSINYNCGEYDLDLAQNLPEITSKDFVSSFIKQFNLYTDFIDGKVVLTPQRYFYSDQSYDITSRVVSNSWSSTPLPTPKTWQIGYSTDDKDRLLTDSINSCISTSSGSLNYGNLEFDNPNASSNNILSNLNMFSSTKFTDGNITLHDITSGTGVTFPQTTPDPASGLVIYKGIEAGTQIPLGAFVDLQLPSIQSQESFDQVRLGDLTYDYNYTPRLIYHLGTVNQFTPLDNNYQCLVDSPRADANFILKDKHWFRPTVSQFDHENEVFTGISYPSLRYDRSTYDDGLYIKYFENLIQLYNESEMFSVQVALRPTDWNNLTGSLKVRYRDGVYRLNQIKDYDPQTNNICQLTMIKEI